MPKQNAFLARMKLKHDIDMNLQRNFTIQQCKDMALIALSEFGFGAERLKRYSDTYDAVFTAYAEMAVEDGKGDKDIIYTRAKVDEKLKQICGPYFVPWDERYL